MTSTYDQQSAVAEVAKFGEVGYNLLELEGKNVELGAVHVLLKGLKANKKVKFLKISDCKMSEDFWWELFKVLGDTGIVKLRVEKMPLSTTVVNLLFIKAVFSKLETIALVDCDIGHMKLRIMSYGLYATIKELDLSHNSLGQESIDHIASCVFESPSLKALTLRRSCTGADLSGLFDVIKNKKNFKYLDLSGAGIKRGSTVFLFENLKYMSLTHLIYDDMNVEPEEFQRLIDGFAEVTLTNLSLNRNTRIPPDMWLQFLNKAFNSPMIQIINLRGCEIDVRHMPILLKFAETHPTIEFIDVRETALTVEDLNLLEKAFTRVKRPRVESQLAANVV